MVNRDVDLSYLCTLKDSTNSLTAKFLLFENVVHTFDKYI